jgi:hypothetical protein
MVSREKSERSIYGYFRELLRHSTGETEKRHAEFNSAGNPTDAMIELGTSFFEYKSRILLLHLHHPTANRTELNSAYYKKLCIF